MRDRTSLPDRLKLPVMFDSVRLAEDLTRLSPEDWIAHFLEDRYTGNWDVIPLRGPAGAQHPVLMIVATPGATTFEDAPALAHCPYFRDVIDSFQAEVRGVRLLRLTPGSVLLEHTDHENTGDDGILRIHVPVVTNPDVVFLLNGIQVSMEAGSAWYLRLSDPHSVTNGGATDRVHMLIDTVLNDRTAAMLCETAAAAREKALG
jgi:hypothetical protein